MLKKKSNFVGKRINYNAGIQSYYQRAILTLVRQMARQTKNEVDRLFHKGFVKEYYSDLKPAMDESISSQSRILISFLRRKYSTLFSERSQKIINKMISQSSKASSASLSSSLGDLKKISKDLTLDTSKISPELKEILKASVTQNVELLKSIPQEYFKRVSTQVMRSIVNGEGISKLIPYLSQYAGITERHAKFIALDQTRKVYSALNRERMKSLNIGKFEWLHSHGGHTPRESHLKMNGKIFSLDRAELEDAQNDLGVPEADQGFPGEAINCRCTMAAVIQFDEDDE